MDVIISIPVLAAVIGALLFGICSDSTIKAVLAEVGKALLWCGILVALFVAAHHVKAL